MVLGRNQAKVNALGTNPDPGYMTNASFSFSSTRQKLLAIRQYFSIISRHRKVISCIGNNMGLGFWRTWIQVSNLPLNCCVTQWKNCLYEIRIFLLGNCFLYTHMHVHKKCMILVEHVHVCGTSFHLFQYFHFFSA